MTTPQEGAIYLRVSKDDGTMTVDNQRPEVMQMAAGRGYVVRPEHIFVDEASGAKGVDERPALRAMLEAAARGKFRAVLVWALDRLSRDGTFLGGCLMVGELDRFGVALLSQREVWLDTAGPFRTPLVALSLKLAEGERARMIERTNRGIVRARAELEAKGSYWNERKKKTVTHIGRPRVQASDALVARAAEMRGMSDMLPRAWATSWRDVRRRLEAEGFQNVPTVGSLIRLVQNRGRNSTR